MEARRQVLYRYGTQVPMRRPEAHQFYTALLEGPPGPQEDLQKDLHQFSTPDVFSGGPPSWGLEHKDLCLALAVIFLSICSRTILEGGSERNDLGLPLCRYDTGVSGPLIWLPQALDGSTRCSGDALK